MNLHSSLSIVVTYYKGAEFIFTCLNSLIESYNVSEKLISYEIIVVIDSPEDAEWIENELFQKYGSNNISIFKNTKNLGVSKSRNIGLEKITSQFFTIIDQDDFVNQNYFSVLESSLDVSCDIHLINGSVLFKETNKHVPIYYFEPNFSFKSLILQTTNIYTPGLVIFNKNFIKPNHLFIETSDKYKGTDDWAAYLSILSLTEHKLKYKFINSLLFVYCLHSSNYSNNKKEMELSSISVIEYFIKLGSKISPNNYQIAIKAKKRNEFLYALRIDKSPLIKLIKYFPKQILDHYFLSFFKKDRLNRLIFRLRNI